MDDRIKLMKLNETLVYCYNVSIIVRLQLYFNTCIKVSIQHLNHIISFNIFK